MTRPVVELVAAALTMLVGAWLIGWWAVGVVLIVFGAGIAVDALLRDDDDGTPRQLKQRLSDEVLERYRRAR